MYWGLAGTAGVLWFQFSRTDRTKPRNDRMRSLLRGHDDSDPASRSCDPGLFGRQIRLLLIGVPIICAALLLVWLSVQ